MNDLKLIETEKLPARINVEHEVKRAKEYIEKSLAENTIRGHLSQWNGFIDWCYLRDLKYLPAKPETVATYLSFLADNGKKYSTIHRSTFAIGQAHKTNGFESPCKSVLVKKVLSGILREIGNIQDRVDPLTIDKLKIIVEQFDDSALGIRNRALFLIAGFGAFRRSEIVSLLRNDIEFVDKGMKIIVKNSKTDKKKEGMVKPILSQNDKSFCPVSAAKDWMILSKELVPNNKLFFFHLDDESINTKLGQKLNDKMIARMIAKFAESAGIEGWFSGHSFRAGFITSAVLAGKNDRSIMKVSGHRSSAMIARYVRIADEFVENATEGLGE